MKVCCTCKEEKSLEEFGNNKSARDGKSYMCKPCKSAKAKKYRATDKGVASRRGWREGNRDKVNAQKREKRANDPEAREKDRIRKSSKEYKDRACELRSTPEAKAKRSTYKKSEIGRKSSLDSKRRVRDRFINSLIDDLKIRGVSIDKPYIFYHFEIGGIFKFGITQYGVSHRYRCECDLNLIKNVKQYVLGERDARDVEKIVSNKTKDIRYFGDSPFGHTGITELRTEDLTGLVESLISKLNVELIVKKWK